MAMPLFTTLKKQSLSTQERQLHRQPIDMKRIATLILCGGQGSRLFPLTMTHCKPAVSFGGRYRLIDIPLSNAINSGCQKIFIITQFLSTSLHQHLLKTYRQTNSIEILTAEERPKQKVWFQGTADAIRQNLPYLEELPAEYFLILSGDQLYQLEFNNLLKFASETNAEAVVASLPVSEDDAKRMGVLKINPQNFVTTFHEKPQHETDLNKLRLSPEQIQQINHFDVSHTHLGSMGIYLFKRQLLFDILQADPREDFGKHLLPLLVSQGKLAAYVHHGYWQDIGTIESYYKANIALTSSHSPLDYHHAEWKIYSEQHSLPGARISFAQINNSLICEGSIIEAEEVTNSLLGPRSVVGSGSVIRDSYLIGNDFYVSPSNHAETSKKFKIGNNCLIRSAIIDKHVAIGNDVQLINKNRVSHYDSELLYVRDGVIVIPRGATLPDGFTF